MKRRIHILAAIVLVFLANGAAFPFGGEDPMAPGDPWKPGDRARWYHQRITWDAAVAAGFSQGAASTLAWHGDYIDSYLYNPLWWLDLTRGGGTGRVSASVASYNELAKLHFDDSFSRGAVKAAWRKYTLGTMNGLIWALDRYSQGDMTSISAAQNILGISMHAIEDFYSHSNWVNEPARRTKTWFEVPDTQKSTMTLYTGFYEEQGQLGVQGHGKIVPSCAVLRQGAVSTALEQACIGISPMSGMSICYHYRDCKKAESGQPSLFGVTVPSGVVYINPPGMCLDSRWQSKIGVQVRGLKDVTPDQIFDIATSLAQRNAYQWLMNIEWHMKLLARYGQPRALEFWQRVKSTDSGGSKEGEYENFSRFPYHFISAGPYPLNLKASFAPEFSLKGASEAVSSAAAVVTPSTSSATAPKPVDSIATTKDKASATLSIPSSAIGGSVPTLGKRKKRPSSSVLTTLRAAEPTAGQTRGASDPGEHYLRVDIVTANTTFAGTDADVYLRAQGKQFLLDYSPRVGLLKKLIDYNDFEQGKTTTYVVGPFSEVPTSFTLYNDSRSFGDALLESLKWFIEKIGEALSALGDFLLSLIGGNADLIGPVGHDPAKLMWSSDTLAAIGPAGLPFSKKVDGGDEGIYSINGTIRKVGESQGLSPSASWIELEVKLDSLFCNDESSWDRGSDSDEPFVLALLVPLPGEVQKLRTQPFSDVDDGETRGIGQTFGRVRIPRHGGMLSLPVQVWESDDEADSQRKNLLDEFANSLTNQTAPPRQGLLDIWGQAIAADWKIDRISAYTFGRTQRGLYSGEVLNQPVNAWLEGKQSRAFTLNTRRVRFYPVTDYNLQTTNPSEFAKPFTPGRPETKVSIPINRSAPAGGKPAGTKIPK